MGMSNDLSNYEDLLQYLDQALASVRGIEVILPDHGKAVHMRQRLYHMRSLLKRASLDLYDPGDPRRATTPYDQLQFKVSSDKTDPTLKIMHGSPIEVREL